MPLDKPMYDLDFNYYNEAESDIFKYGIQNLENSNRQNNLRICTPITHKQDVLLCPFTICFSQRPNTPKSGCQLAELVYAYACTQVYMQIKPKKSFLRHGR